ncbi:hypothetical protein B0H14DRAFT_2618868 [Mycena olivaceomarginata]|nr:hypothetical protein B0H14DRAFT_2618868 [Mycena olivaceomarginata]
MLLLVNGVYKLTQIVPHRGLSSDLAVLACEHDIAAALPAAYYYCTLVVGNNNSLVQLLDGLTRQDGTCGSLPLLDLRRCLIGCGHLLVKQFQPGYTLGWLRVWLQSPTCAAQVRILPLHGRRRRCGATQARQGVPDALRRVCEGGCQQRRRRPGAVWEELPGCLSCRLGELKDSL